MNWVAGLSLGGLPLAVAQETGAGGLSFGKETLLQDEPFTELERIDRDEWLLSHYMILRDDPQNYEAHMQLAALYLSEGEGPEAVSHIKTAMEVAPEFAVSHRAYTMLAAAYYYAGQLQKSYAAVEEAVRRDEDDAMARGFKTMLETLAEKQYKGRLPEAVDWNGYNSVGEMIRALHKEGIGIVGPDDDAVMFESAQIYLDGPRDWVAAANREGQPDKAFLFYTPGEDGSLPVITVTKEYAQAGMRSPEEFLRHIKAYMRKTFPSMAVSEPRLVRINGHYASFVEMEDRGNDRYRAAYQFLLSDRIISLQLDTTPDRQKEDAAILRRVARSVHIETD